MIVVVRFSNNAEVAELQQALAYQLDKRDDTFAFIDWTDCEEAVEGLAMMREISDEIDAINADLADHVSARAM